MWKRLKDQLVAETENLTMGNVTDLSNFMGAVIDDRAFAKHKKAITRAKRSSKLDILAGGQLDDSIGYFVRPTIIESSDPTDAIFSEEYFGPILGVHVYDDARFEAVVDQMESVAPYALTGAVIAQDREAIAWTTRAAPLRRRQLLRQRQADRRRRRAAAVRWCTRVRHQRQGRRTGQPDALDVGPLDQGDLRATEGPSLPAHGLTSVLLVDTPCTWARSTRSSRS